MNRSKLEVLKRDSWVELNKIHKEKQLLEIAKSLGKIFHMQTEI